MLSSSLKNEREYRERFSDRVTKLQISWKVQGKSLVIHGVVVLIVTYWIQDVKATMLSIYGVAALELEEVELIMSNNSSGADANIGGALLRIVCFRKQNSQNELRML